MAFFALCFPAAAAVHEPSVLLRLASPFSHEKGEAHVHAAGLTAATALWAVTPLMSASPLHIRSPR